MKVRDISIIVFALLVSIVLFFATRYLLQGEGGNSSGKKVLVAATNIAVGSRVDPKNLTWQTWPKSTIQPLYITDDKKDEAKKLEGALVRNPVVQGEPILIKDFVVGKDGLLSAVVDAGMRP